jgi:hypothetical protein
LTVISPVPAALPYDDPVEKLSEPVDDYPELPAAVYEEVGCPDVD